MTPPYTGPKPDNADRLLRHIAAQPDDRDELGECQLRWIVRAARLYTAGDHRKLGNVLDLFERAAAAEREQDQHTKAEEAAENAMAAAENAIDKALAGKPQRKAKARRSRR